MDLKILVMGGTRFVGKALVGIFLKSGHEVTLFTRGKNAVPNGACHIQGDRKTEDLYKLKGMKFDVIVDSSGRTLDDTQNVISNTGYPNYRFIYISSAGIYSSNYELPIVESSSLDPTSRHKGKAETEAWLRKERIPFTAFRPTYIYGPDNYNPIERWFFDRIVHSRPIPIPDKGELITQLGHVSDLAEAICLSLKSIKSENRCYNCSGDKGITLYGLTIAAAKAANVDPSLIKFRHFDSSLLDPKARKAYPLRLSHFLTDISKIKSDLNWIPKFNINDGLKDSFNNDYLINPTINPDFSVDDELPGI